MFNLTIILKVILALVIGFSIIAVGNGRTDAIIMAILITGLSIMVTIAGNNSAEYKQQTEEHGNNSVLCNCICNIQEPIQN